MSINQFKQLYLNDGESVTMTDLTRSINIIQGNIASSLNPLIIKTSNDPTNLKNISLIAGQRNVINHSLGRKLLGYNVMLKKPDDTSINITISNDQDNNPSQNLTLWLWTNVNCQINLQVY